MKLQLKKYKKTVIYEIVIYYLYNCVVFQTYIDENKFKQNK